MVNSFFVYKPFEVDVSVYFVTMEKTEYRAVIKFFVLEGLSATEIHTKMVKVLKESAPSFPTVHRWVLEFKRGRTSVEDEPRSGRPKSGYFFRSTTPRHPHSLIPPSVFFDVLCSIQPIVYGCRRSEEEPKSATTPEIIEQVFDIFCKDPSLTKREIADTIGISDERVLYILHEELHMKKLFGKLVPHSLTIQQKLNRKQISQRNLKRFKQNQTDFVRRFITMDETWIYHHDPKLKQERLQWIEAGSSAPKQVKSERSAKKIMASIFWDAKGVLLIDYLEKGKTINSEYYCNLLDQLDKNIREKRSGLQKKTIIFHQDNARVHTSFLTMVKLNELKYELFEHPPYSPDLAPSDYYLFRNLKQFLRGKRFSSNEEAIAAVEQYFAELPENHYRDGIKLLEDRWNKCVQVEGDYIE